MRIQTSGAPARAQPLVCPLRSPIPTNPPLRSARPQEEMYSFVTVAGDQSTKGKGTTVVADA